MSAEDGIKNIIDGVTQEGGTSGAIKGGMVGAAGGAALGGAVGFALGGPVGAAAGAVTGGLWQGFLGASRGSQQLNDREED